VDWRSLAGASSLVMGFYCLTLPHTPPQPGKAGDFAPGAVVRSFFTQRNLLVLLVVTLLIGVAHQFFFVWNSPFLKDILRSGGWTGAAEQRIASIGQICEVAVMAGLGLAIVRLGFKRVMLAGIVAYTARCVIFAVVFGFGLSFEAKLALAALGQALHGFCFGCFLAAAFMYIDRAVSKDLRGSMQTLYGTTVLGIGFFLGGWVGGRVGEVFTTAAGEEPFRRLCGRRHRRRDRGVRRQGRAALSRLARHLADVRSHCRRGSGDLRSGVSTDRAGRGR
jgi:hypothetical protein